jgi:short subunit dehydrogenase-like uncharacterized protein
MPSHTPDEKVPKSSFVLYGATGYSGCLLARRALEAGLTPVLAGRDPARLGELGRELGLDFRVAPLDQPAMLASLLDGGEVVLNAAGPFSATAPKLQAAALARRAHYLDLSGEVATLEAAARAHHDARARGVMLMPGVGFDVVPSDCLAVHVARGLGNVEQLSLAVFGMGPPSRGSARTLAEQAGKPILVRRAGVLSSLPPGSGERHFEVNGESLAAVPVSWGDLVTSHVSTGAQDITVYFEATPELRMALAASRIAQVLGASSVGATLARAQADLLAAKPRASSERVCIVAEAKGKYGVRKALLWTPDVYAITADTAVAVIKRVLSGDVEPGFQTPGRLYGPDFVLSLPGVERMDVAG